VPRTAAACVALSCQTELMLASIMAIWSAIARVFWRRRPAASASGEPPRLVVPPVR
jgi:hypothetical protein